jgi:hypothetical protein
MIHLSGNGTVHIILRVLRSFLADWLYSPPIALEVGPSLKVSRGAVHERNIGEVFG